MGEGWGEGQPDAQSSLLIAIVCRHYFGWEFNWGFQG
jgi:hypothetical protein